MLGTIAGVVGLLAGAAAGPNPGDPGAAARPVDFRTDVVAALSRAGCNSGPCHGSPQGKNGFRLSLRGFDPDLDFGSLTRADHGRRVDRASPANSLFLLKGTGAMPHLGGVRLRPGDPAYRILHGWVAQGCRDAGPSPVARLEVTPERLVLPADRPEQQLSVRAHFQDGRVRDVTALTVFSLDDTSAAGVTPDGLVRFTRTGEVAVLARYLDHFAGARLRFVNAAPAFAYRSPPAVNVIDRHVFAKQRELHLLPARLANDPVFLRRVHLDVTGTLPTGEEARAFLADPDPDKRAKLIDALLGRDEYASFWALKWADVLRGTTTTLSKRGVYSFHRYLVKAVAEDRPLDRFARELLTGLGNTLHRPEASFYRTARTPEECAESFAQVFLGVRMQCARCHNHPFEGITQTDYFGLAAYFAQVDRKGAKFMLDDEVVFLNPGREVRNPRTNQNQPPVAFGDSPGKLTPDEDRRERLAAWVARPDNPYFAASLANRAWYHLFGQGVVEPVDDFRATNPPSNPELMDALRDEFVRNGYRLRPLLRLILNSSTYQLDSAAPTQVTGAARPDRYFTHARVKMLSAEQVVDAVSLATGVPEKFPGHPEGTRAIELAEGAVAHPFLQAFARPVRDVNCECAREEDPSLPQMMHLLNNAGLLAKLKSPGGRVAGWAGREVGLKRAVESVYLATLSRLPRAEELAVVARHEAGLGGDRLKALQDLQFALMNSGEFLLRH